MSSSKSSSARTPNSSRIEGVRKNLSPEEIKTHSDRSRDAFAAKRLGLTTANEIDTSTFPVPRFDPSGLMPRLSKTNFKSLSLFSGGGGLDLGFDIAGFNHFASWEIVQEAANTLLVNHPDWDVRGGDSGDVKKANWSDIKDQIDVIHGGPPCQPFSSAGRQLGELDPRDMWPEFVRSVLALKPKIFLAENVAALGNEKFSAYREEVIYSKLRGEYELDSFVMRAEEFGVPQSRKRLILIGVRRDLDFTKWCRPQPTHVPYGKESLYLPSTPGIRESLGLPDIGRDGISPTIRCSWTGPRGTTSILSSASAAKTFHNLQIWPNGVAADRLSAAAFPARDGHYRLSVEEVALIQGFPEDWKFAGSTYMQLGQIGNSVAPPIAYHLAKSIRDCLEGG